MKSYRLKIAFSNRPRFANRLERCRVNRRRNRIENGAVTNETLPYRRFHLEMVNPSISSINIILSLLKINFLRIETPKKALKEGVKSKPH